MKAILVTTLIFGIVITCVVIYSVDFGEKQARDESPHTVPATVVAAPVSSPITPASTKPEAPCNLPQNGVVTVSAPAVTPPEPAEPETPEETEPQKPKTQVIERVYVREVHYVREVVHEPARNDEPVAYNQQSNNEGGYAHERTYPVNHDRCESFTGEARNWCRQLIQYAGNRCDRYEGTLNYYSCLKYYGGYR